MKLKNTHEHPLALFYTAAGEAPVSTVLDPSESTDIELNPGDSLTMRVATEFSDPGGPKHEAAKAQEALAPGKGKLAAEVAAEAEKAADQPETDRKEA